MLVVSLAQANANNPKAVIEDVVYPDIPRDLLLELIKDLRHRGKWYQGQVREKIHSNYAYGSRTQPMDPADVGRLESDLGVELPIGLSL